MSTTNEQNLLGGTISLMMEILRFTQNDRGEGMGHQSCERAPAIALAACDCYNMRTRPLVPKRGGRFSVSGVGNFNDGSR